MDKPDYIRMAPAYYVAALMIEVKNVWGQFTEDTLRRNLSYPEDSARYPGSYLEHDILLKHALAVLVEANVCEEVADPFGPTLYAKNQAGFDQYEKTLLQERGPYFKAVGPHGSYGSDGRYWIRVALENVNKAFGDLQLTEADFADPDRDWQPIPLDRNTEQYKEAIEAVDDAIEQVDGNNGYASHYPEERSFVLDNLRQLSNKLKTAATISLGYVRAHGLEVLRKLSERFGGAAIGEAAKRAISALWSWLF